MTRKGFLKRLAVGIGAGGVAASIADSKSVDAGSSPAQPARPKPGDGASYVVIPSSPMVYKMGDAVVIGGFFVGLAAEDCKKYEMLLVQTSGWFDGDVSIPPNTKLKWDEDTPVFFW